MGRFKVPNNSGSVSGISFYPQGCQTFEAEILVADIGAPDGLGRRTWRYLVGLKALTYSSTSPSTSPSLLQDVYQDEGSEEFLQATRNRVEHGAISQGSSTETDSLSALPFDLFRMVHQRITRLALPPKVWKPKW